MAVFLRYLLNLSSPDYPLIFVAAAMMVCIMVHLLVILL